MSKHSAIVGGSTAGRLLACPASLSRTRALPPSADAPSEYADEGTAMHAVMDHLMRWRVGGVDIMLNPRDWIGQTFHDRPLTDEHLDTMVYPALEHLQTLEQEFDTGGAFEVAGVEQRVTFPGIPGAFGTVDLILQNDRFTLLVDWKFGQGIGVKTVYSDGDGAIVNPQMMYYAAAALKPVERTVAVNRREVTPYGEYLARAKALTDTVLQFKTELDSQMHAYLENGGAIPGWRLKDKATRRQWVDDKTVSATLGDLGFLHVEIWRKPELVTFQQADATAKRRGVEIPDKLRVAPPPSGTTLATVDDPAPVVEPPSTLMEKFAASLRLLEQQGQE